MSQISGRIRARVGALASSYELPDDAAAQLAALLELVATDPLAPTTVRDPSRALDDHLADSLVALELGPVREASAISDLGSGAGFPGLPLAISLPAAHVWLVESNARKCAFLERVAATCEISNVDVIHARAESWGDGLNRCDLVTVRAVAALDVIAEYAAPLLRSGGALVAWRGQRDLEAELAAQRAAIRLGLEVLEPLPVRPYPGARNRYLHVMSKVRCTPPGFPRRPGVALKRPLGRVSAPSDR